MRLPVLLSDSDKLIIEASEPVVSLIHRIERVSIHVTILIRLGMRDPIAHIKSGSKRLPAGIPEAHR